MSVGHGKQNAGSAALCAGVSIIAWRVGLSEILKLGLEIVYTIHGV